MSRGTTITPAPWLGGLTLQYLTVGDAPTPTLSVTRAGAITMSGSVTNITGGPVILNTDSLIMTRGQAYLENIRVDNLQVTGTTSYVPSDTIGELISDQIGVGRILIGSKGITSHYFSTRVLDISGSGQMTGGFSVGAGLTLTGPLQLAPQAGGATLNTGIYSNGSSTVSLYTANAERLRVDVSGYASIYPSAVGDSRLTLNAGTTSALRFVAGTTASRISVTGGGPALLFEPGTTSLRVTNATQTNTLFQITPAGVTAAGTLDTDQIRINNNLAGSTVQMPAGGNGSVISWNKIESGQGYTELSLGKGSSAGGFAIYANNNAAPSGSTDRLLFVDYTGNMITRGTAMANGLTVNGPTTLYGGLTATGAVAASSLTAGSATVNGPLTVNGTITMNGALTATVAYPIQLF